MAGILLKGCRCGVALWLPAGLACAVGGLTDIPRTVRGRLIVSHDFGAGWGATLGVSADLLGRWHAGIALRGRRGEQWVG